jgi:hypothetical protein
MSAAGTWNMTIDTPIGKQHATLVFTENADGSWAGTSRSTESGEEGPLEDLAVAGNEVTWHQSVTKPMKLNLKCTVTIDGDKLSGKAKAGMFPAVTMNGERAS